MGETPWRWERATDVDTVHALLTASDAHHAAVHGLPLPVRRTATTRRRVVAGEVHLLRRGPEPVGMFTLTPEPPFDADLSLFPPARLPLYLQRLVVAPAWLQPGSLVGLRCLRHAADLARAAGADALRAEANPDLTTTVAVFGRFGFQRYGRIRAANGLRRTYLQKDLVPARSSAPGAQPTAATVMRRQVACLAADLRALAPTLAGQARSVLLSLDARCIRDVHLTGAGDSYHAACASEMAYQTIAGVPCEASSVQRFLGYRLPGLRLRPGRPLVVAASVSGRTPRTVAALERARRLGAATIAVTGDAGSPAARAADHALVPELTGLERAPGIRTYQATLLAMLLLAIELAPARGPGGEAARHTAYDELLGLAVHVDSTAGMVADGCHRLAGEVVAAPASVVLGSGPGYGTALFAAAKLVEAAGAVAIGQDIEEWWHVERRIRPAGGPVFVIAPPGRSRGRARSAAAAARRLGHRVIAVADQHDAVLAGLADTVLPVSGPVREEFSPLLFHLFAGVLAGHLTDRLGRRLFEPDPPGLPRTLDDFYT